MSMSFRLKYSREDLLRLRSRGLPLLRSIRRELWYSKLLLKKPQDVSLGASRRIPVIIRPSASSSRRVDSLRPSFRSSSLVRVKLQQIPRSGRGTMPSILFANVRSLFNKTDEVALLLRQHHVPLAFFVETWLHEDVPDEAVAVEGYSVVRRDRGVRAGGGIICYFDSALHPIVINSQKVPAMGNCSTEFLSLFFPCLSLLTIACYHPFWNNPSEHDSAISCITDIMDYVAVNESCSRKLRIILLGDFNDLCKLADSITNITELSPVINFPTREARTIDQIFTNCQSDYLSPERLSPIGHSDHCTILWRSSTSTHKSSKLKVRKISKSRLVAFYAAIASTDWMRTVEGCMSLDDSFDQFQNFLLALVNHFFPFKTIRVRDSEPPWMRVSLKLLIDDRDRAFSKNQLHKFDRLRKEVINHLHHLKSEYLKKAIASGNVKSLWSAISHLSKRRSNYSCEQFPPDVFSDYFSSNFQTADSFENFDDSLNNLMSSTLCLSVSDVRMSMSQIKKVSSGPDGIPTWVFRNCCDDLAPVVTLLFNRSLKEGHVPSSLKRANVLPIPKCPHPCQVSDFRPISILPVLSKIFEKLVCRKWLIPSIHHKVNPNQFAYVPGSGKGTECALTAMYLHALKFLDTQSGVVRVAAIDLAKAFDSLPHGSIIDASIRFSLSRELVKWIRSYLSQRFQRVVAANSFSSWAPLTSGVPQGSVIGPILFCLVMDSLSTVCTNSKLFMYADDITIMHFFRHNSEDNLQMELDNVSSWCENLRLNVNLSKCFVMDIITRVSLTCHPLYFHDNMLKCVSSLKILGCLLSHDLKWNLFVDFLVKKASRRVYLILCLKRANCPAHVLYMSFCAFIRPILLYAYPAWCNLPEYLRKKLLAVERRVLRIIDCDLYSASLFTFGDHMCLKLYRKVIQQEDHPLRCFFSTACARDLRSSAVLRRPKTRTQRFLHSFIRFSS